MDSQVNLVQSTWQSKDDYAVFSSLADRIYELRICPSFDTRQYCVEVDEVKRTKTQRWLMEDSNFRYFTEGDAFRRQF